MKFDVIIIGGGLAGMTAGEMLQGSGLKCAVIAEGRSLWNVSSKVFEDAGGEFLAGDRVVSGTFEGNALKSVRTGNLGEFDLEADTFIIATGKYFSRGLVADMDKIYEPVFGLDVDYDTDRSNWFNFNFSGKQNFMEFGVFTDEKSRPSIDGQVIENLYAAGEILPGINCVAPDAEQAIRASVEKVVMIIK